MFEAICTILNKYGKVEIIKLQKKHKVESSKEVLKSRFKVEQTSFKFIRNFCK